MSGHTSTQPALFGTCNFRSSRFRLRILDVALLSTGFLRTRALDTIPRKYNLAYLGVSDSVMTSLVGKASWASLYFSWNIIRITLNAREDYEASLHLKTGFWRWKLIISNLNLELITQQSLERRVLTTLPNPTPLIYFFSYIWWEAKKIVPWFFSWICYKIGVHIGDITRYLRPVCGMGTYEFQRRNQWIRWLIKCHVRCQQKLRWFLYHTLYIIQGLKHSINGKKRKSDTFSQLCYIQLRLQANFLFF